MRLSNRSKGAFKKDTWVVDLYPKTTTFYRAVISNDPVWISTAGNSKPSMVNSFFVQFDYDKNDDGCTLHKQVQSKHLLPIPKAFFHS